MDPDAAAGVLARLEPSARLGLAEELRQALFGDGALARHEAHVMARVAGLLGLPPAEGPER
ncbi:MAG: hypothetical protein H6R40_207 [Gemmatimonadetes bacterium]|nr:hypothetical protein [Gemmatimonadota bacterium]